MENKYWKGDKEKKKKKGKKESLIAGSAFNLMATQMPFITTLTHN